MMDNETEIERSIKSFVFTKIQEQVFLDVGQKNTISIKHKSKHGSTALAMFWLRVLRHQNNYPMPKYPYKDVYDKDGNDKIVLKVDSVTLTTYLRTGMLMIQGSFVLEWFLSTFPTIMNAYDAPIADPQPKSTVYRQYTESWKKLEEYYKDVKDAEERDLRAREEVALSIIEDRDLLISKTEQESTSQGDKDVRDPTKASIKLQQAADLIAEETAEEMELMALEIWPAEIVEQQLDKLRQCHVRDSQMYIYPLWKSLLHHWFSDASRKVYIVTPFLDVKRLVNVCKTILQHRITANLDCFYVRQSCNHDQSIFEVKQKALRNFDAKDQMFIEYKIFSNIVYPMKKFNAKFIASIKGDVAEVLVTSANFHADHFDCANLDTVFFQTMPECKFIRGFLGPIIASMHANK